MKTWTEDVDQLDATAVLTRRAGAEACRQVGQQARPVAAVAREFGVCWWTVMNAVIEHGTPLVDTPDRVGTVTKLGVDETSFQAARPGQATKYVTGLVDLERRAMIDMTPGNRAADLRRWCANADPAWIAEIGVVATDLAESYRAGLSPHLDHCVRVADGCRTNSSATAAANETRCSRSARSCSPAPNESRRAARTGCCSVYALATRTTSSSAPGSPRSP
jgi:transposase